MISKCSKVDKLLIGLRLEECLDRALGVSGVDLVEHKDKKCQMFYCEGDIPDTHTAHNNSWDIFKLQGKVVEVF